MTLREMWRRFSPARYTRALEAEVERLRAENRALLNSILGIAGIPPIPVMAGDLARGLGHVDAEKDSGVNDAAVFQKRAGGTAKIGVGKRPIWDPNFNGKTIMASMRRRSWHQINRMLEFESAKRANREQ
ncbi:MAG: hypothetical protein WA663_08085 [Candidatus Acidiferrales bacterium]